MKKLILLSLLVFAGLVGSNASAMDAAASLATNAPAPVAQNVAKGVAAGADLSPSSVLIVPAIGFAISLSNTSLTAGDRVRLFIGSAVITAEDLALRLAAAALGYDISSTWARGILLCLIAVPIARFGINWVIKFFLRKLHIIPKAPAVPVIPVPEEAAAAPAPDAAHAPAAS